MSQDTYIKRFPTVQDMDQHGLVDLFDMQKKKVSKFPMIDAREICAQGRYTAEIPPQGTPGVVVQAKPNPADTFLEFGLLKLREFADQAGVSSVGMSADKIIDALVKSGFTPPSKDADE